jgi:hypothetical protein
MKHRKMAIYVIFVCRGIQRSIELHTCLWYTVSGELYCIAFEQIKNISLCIQQFHSQVSLITVESFVLQF